MSKQWSLGHGDSSLTTGVLVMESSFCSLGSLEVSTAQEAARASTRLFGDAVEKS